MLIPSFPVGTGLVGLEWIDLQHIEVSMTAQLMKFSSEKQNLCFSPLKTISETAVQMGKAQK